MHIDWSPFDVYIGRGPGKWGNPFIIGKDGTRADVIAKHTEWLRQQPELVAALPELRDKKLGCHCAPDPCHGDVLARWANQPQKIAIVGSRDYPNLAEVKRYVLGLAPGTVIVSGGARGVDRAGELAAYEAGFGVIIHFPNWQRDGKDAGLLRNGLIVQSADKIVVFWNGFSTGSSHVTMLARASGKPVELFICRRAPKGVTDNPGTLQRLPDNFWGGRNAQPAPKTPAQAAARRQRGR